MKKVTDVDRYVSHSLAHYLTTPRNPGESAIRRAVHVGQVMTWPASVVAPSASVRDALWLVRHGGFHHLPVVDAGRLAGLLCTCDVVAALPTARVDSCMSAPVITVRPTANLWRAARLMDDHGVDCLPTFWREAWGVVTRGDLIRAGACEEASRPRCVACGGVHHVRADRDGHRYWCLACTQPLGEGDAP